MYTSQKTLCKPNTKIVHRSANRGSGVVFLIASGFLQQKTDVVTMKGAAVNSLYINILWWEGKVMQYLILYQIAFLDQV